MHTNTKTKRYRGHTEMTWQVFDDRITILCIILIVSPLFCRLNKLIDFSTGAKT